MLQKFRDKLSHRAPGEILPRGERDVREAAVLIPIIQADEPEIVFIKRAEHLSTHRGQVGFPGGMWEPGDATLIHTALRESEEEIALPPEKVEIIAALEPEITLYSVRVTPFLGFIPHGLSFVPELAELDAVFQVPLSHLLTETLHTESEFTTVGGIYTAPCIYFGDYCIWGITYRIMLRMFKEVFGFDPGADLEPVQIRGV